MQFAFLRYLVDGIRIQDLLPAYEAIMENVWEARKFGAFAFAVMMIVYIVNRVIRRAVDFDFVGNTESLDTVVHDGNRVGVGIFHHSRFREAKHVESKAIGVYDDDGYMQD